MKYKCKYCGEEFEKRSLGGHTKFCKLNPNYNKNIKQLEDARSHISKTPIVHKGKECSCQYCGRLYKLYGLKNHEIRCALNPNKDKSPRYYHGGGGWNKGLTKETDERLAKASETMKQSYKSGKTKVWCDGLTKETDERIARYAKKISKTSKEHGLSGGYRKGIGRGKKGWYKGIFCDSSWELAFVIYHIDHNIPIKRCEQKLEYIMNGRLRKYLPDFEVGNKIVEIKGWKDETALIKEKEFPDIIVIDKISIIPYIKYVINKYGKNFIDLYEK